MHRGRQVGPRRFCHGHSPEETLNEARAPKDYPAVLILLLSLNRLGLDRTPLAKRQVSQDRFTTQV